MKTLLCLSAFFMLTCTSPDYPSTVTTHSKDTTCPRPETKADQEAQQAVYEAELRKNEKMKKETN